MSDRTCIALALIIITLNIIFKAIARDHLSVIKGWSYTYRKTLVLYYYYVTIIFSSVRHILCEKQGKINEACKKLQDVG